MTFLRVSNFFLTVARDGFDFFFELVFLIALFGIKGFSFKECLLDSIVMKLLFCLVLFWSQIVVADGYKPNNNCRSIDAKLQYAPTKFERSFKFDYQEKDQN